MKTTRIRALHDFDRLSDADLVARSTAVHTGITDNPHFTNLPFDLSAFKASIGSFSEAIAEAMDGGKKAIAEKNNLRPPIIDTMRLAARYVEIHSKNDMAIFTSSGLLPASNTRATPQQLAQPGIRKIKQGSNSGQLLVSLKPVSRAFSYELRYSASGDSGVPGSWATLPVTSVKSAVSVDGLTPGQSYAFQVRALGKLGYTDWSDSASRMVI